MQKPIICNDLKYKQKTTYMQKGEIYARGNLYAKTYNMQGQNICKDL